MKTIITVLALSATVIACRSGARSSSSAAATPTPTVASAPQDIMVRSRVEGDSFTPRTGAAALRAFVPDVPADETGGECEIHRTTGSGATVVIAHYPRRTGARLQINVTFDSVGHVVKYVELRGVLELPHTPLSGAQLDTAIRAAQARVRSTSIQLDYPVDQAMVTNRGAGKPSEMVMGTVRAVESLPALGDVPARIERMRKLCGV